MDTKCLRSVKLYTTKAQNLIINSTPRSTSHMPPKDCPGANKCNKGMRNHEHAKEATTSPKTRQECAPVLKARRRTKLRKCLDQHPHRHENHPSPPPPTARTGRLSRAWGFFPCPSTPAPPLQKERIRQTNHTRNPTSDVHLTLGTRSASPRAKARQCCR